MKVVAYCFDTNKKILLARANGKRHDITVISNALNADTVGYANGKSAVILCSDEIIHADLLAAFNSLGVRLIITTFIVDEKSIKNARYNYDICIVNLSSAFINYGEIVRTLDNWQASQYKKI